MFSVLSYNLIIVDTAVERKSLKSYNYLDYCIWMKFHKKDQLLTYIYYIQCGNGKAIRNTIKNFKAVVSKLFLLSLKRKINSKSVDDTIKIIVHWEVELAF